MPTDEVYVVVAFNLQPHRPPAVVIRAFWDESMAEDHAKWLRREKGYVHVRMRKVKIAPVGM